MNLKVLPAEREKDVIVDLAEMQSIVPPEPVPVVAEAKPAAPPSPVVPGLMGWWKLDEGSGAKAADSSGIRHDGKIVGALWAEGKTGKSLAFDGKGAYVEIKPRGAFLKPTKAISVCAWVKVAPDSGDGVVVCKGAASGNPIFQYQYVLWFRAAANSQAGPAMCFSVAGRDAGEVAGPAIRPGEWAFVAGVFDPAKGKESVYVNGECREKEIKATDLWQMPKGVPITEFVDLYPLYLGCRSSTIGGQWAKWVKGVFTTDRCHFFKGAIDNVRVYDRALNAEEIGKLSGR